MARTNWLNEGMEESLVVDPLLLRAVPASLRPDAQVAMRALMRTEYPTFTTLVQDTHAYTARYPEIFVDGELVQIPSRHYYAWPSDERVRGLSDSQFLVLACWMSRNNDGWNRQKALGHILNAEAAWTIPYVIQLCGEYVVEIGQDIYRFFTSVLPNRPALKDRYLRFAQDNPNFMEITMQRAVSYWNDDYRTEMSRDEYPQLAALKTLARLSG